MEIKDLTGLSQPLEKLVDATRAGIGKFYEPTHIRRMAKAEAEANKILGESSDNNLYLPAKYVDGKYEIDTEKEGIVMRAQSRFIEQQIQKQQNIENIYNNAYDELEKEEKISDEPVDEDWIKSFFTTAEDITNEEMQKFWGRILAGEIKKPKSFSLRTLEKLKSLSAEEAKLFEKIAPFCLFSGDKAFLHEDLLVLQWFPISFGEIIQLEEYGLLNTTIAGLLMPIPKKEQGVIIHNNNIAIALEPSPNATESFYLNTYPITSFGYELLNALQLSQHDKFILKLATSLQSTYTDLNFSAYRILEKDSIGMKYDTKDLLKK